MPKSASTITALVAVTLICGTVAAQAQETADIANSDLAGVVAAARSQIPSELDSGSLQTYLDGVAAYIYGYPLIAIAMTERVSTNVESPGQKLGRAPINQLYSASALPVGSAFKDVVLPSTTTMYSVGFFNLEKEPLILHLPTITSDRFFIVQLMDAWTNVSRKSPSSRQGSMAPGDYALVGPDWKGRLPSNVSDIIRFDTNTAWQIMRVYTTGTKIDQDFVSEQIFNKMTLKPLSANDTNYTPPVLPVNPSIDGVTQPINQVDSMGACEFFGTMSAMMMSNSARKVDVALVPILQRLGIIGDADAQTPTQFSCSKLIENQDEQTIRALQLAVGTGKRILNKPVPPSLTTTNWSVSLNVGDYGTQYVLRAIVAKKALGANRPQDAVYGYGVFDSAGTEDSNYLTGANRYKLHFKPRSAGKGPTEIPPIDGNGFWSITMYDVDGLLVDNQNATWNALSTTEVQGHTSCLNDDKSLDVYVQATPPTDPKQYCNWLETPQPTAKKNGQFILFLRMYWPDRAITNGQWYPPAVEKLN